MSEKKVKCDICLWDDTNDVLYGDWKSSEPLAVHYFCLLSAPDIPQRGKDKEGILGFLPLDIAASLKHFVNNECFYCGLKSAAVKCAEKDCNRYWHYPCGTRNSCITQFFGEFKSFCNLHVPDFNKGKTHGSAYCLACLDFLDAYHPSTSIISSCCLKLDDWYECFVHKNCAMRYTKNAGYDSMCINCSMNDGVMTKEVWQNEMRLKGIFIPMQESVWEQEGHFKDQVKNKCEHPKCNKPSSKSNVWTCFVCGCFPQHLKCSKVKTPEEYYCPNCYDQSFVERVPKFLKM